MPHIKSQFSHTTLFHEPWRSLGHRVCYKCNAPIRVNDWNWTSNTSNGSKYGYTKLPVEHPEKYSHADCTKPASYKQWEDPNKQKQNPWAKPQEGSNPQDENASPKPITEPIATPTEPVETPEKPTPIIDTPKPVSTPDVDNSIVGWFETNSLDHVQFKELYRIISTRNKKTKRLELDLYLGGSPGAGKSYAIKSCAERMGLPYAFLALSDATMPSFLFGFQNAEGDFVPTLFYDFYCNGGVLDIAELDNANANVFTLLNNALDNGHCTFPGRHKGEAFQLIQRHPDFVVVGNGNTFLRGPSKMYPARTRQDAASVERFLMLNWRYDNELETNLLMENEPEPLPKLPLHERTLSKATCKGIALWCQKLRDICSPTITTEGGVKKELSAEELVVSPRGSKKTKRLMEIGFSSRDAVQIAIFKEYAGTEKLLKLCPINF